MKKIVVLAGLLSAIFFGTAHAQVNISFNIGSQPVWGPTGYDYARYYYMPDYDIYYDITRQEFVYPNRGRWVTVRSLPPTYRNVNLYSTYKVVINDANPWMRNNVYRAKYQSYKGRGGQTVIRDSRDEKYYIIKDHPQHDMWQRNHNKVIIQERGHDNRGRGNNNGRGHGRGR